MWISIIWSYKSDQKHILFIPTIIEKAKGFDPYSLPPSHDYATGFVINVIYTYLRY